MQRRIYHLLKNKGSLNESEAEELVNFLKTSFFKPILTPLKYRDLISLIDVQQICQKKAVIFEENSRIYEYLFLLEGKVSISKKVEDKQQIEILQIKESGNIIGEFFYNNNNLRQYTAFNSTDEGPCIIISINSQIYKEICENQIKQYTTVLRFIEEFAQLANIMEEKIDFYKKLDYKIQKYNDKILLNDRIALIYEGECVLKRKSIKHHKSIKKMKAKPGSTDYNIAKIQLCKMDCLNLDSFFGKDAEKSYKSREKYGSEQYTVVSQSITLILIPFEIIPEMPKEFLKKIQFISKCHQINLNSINFTSKENAINLQEKEINQQSIPLLNRSKTQKQNCTSARNIHKIEAGDQSFTKEIKFVDLLNFRKEYCLGFNLKTKFDMAKLRQQRQIRVSSKGPSSYFMHQKQKVRAPTVKLQNREWAEYLGEQLSHSFDKNQYILNKKPSSLSKNHVNSDEPLSKDYISIILTTVDEIKRSIAPRESCSLNSSIVEEQSQQNLASKNQSFKLPINLKNEEKRMKKSSQQILKKLLTQKCKTGCRQILILPKVAK